jgi:hypothetical protein
MNIQEKDEKKAPENGTKSKILRTTNKNCTDMVLMPVKGVNSDNDQINS